MTMYSVCDKVYKSIDSLQREIDKKNNQLVITDDNLKTVYSNLEKRNDNRTELDKLLSADDNAFLLSYLRKSMASLPSNEHSDEFHAFTEGAHTMAIPIYNYNRIIGYVGFISKDNKQKNMLKVSLELISKVISLELHLDSVRQGISLKDESQIFKELSEREFNIIKLISSGLKDDEIATIMHISSSTVRSYINKLFEKLDVHSKVELVNTYHKMKWEFFEEEVIK